VLAQNHLAAGSGLISSQEALVGRLRSSGRSIALAERILQRLIATQSAQFADLERLRRHASIRIPLGRTLTRGAGRPIDGGMALLSKKGESGTSRWDSLPGLRCPAWERKNQNE
jgi:hypothetical protein